MKKVLTVAAAAMMIAGFSAYAGAECSAKKECSKKKECSAEKTTECAAKKAECTKGK